MIGQEKLLNKFADKNSIPSFCILMGPKGCGKKTFIKSVYNDIIMIEPKVDNIRDMIAAADKSMNTVFVIADADNMSAAAQNAMLKVIEECPHNNKFIMTIESTNTILSTIQSRGVIYEFEHYKPNEIKQYAIKNNESLTKNELDIIADVCETMGDVNILNAYGVSNFYNYVEKVIDNIAEVSGANAFKIGDKINFKDDDSKYDLKMFLFVFRKVCTNKFMQNKNEKYLNGIIITTKYISLIGIKGINKMMLFDAWILDIRKAWIK